MSKISLKQGVQNQIEELEHLDIISPFFFSSLSFANTPQIKIFGFDPDTFHGTLVEQESLNNYTGFDLSTLSTISNGTALTNKAFMERNALEIGDTVSLEFSHIDEIYNITLVGSYNQFPVMRHELAIDNENENTQLHNQLLLYNL